MADTQNKNLEVQVIESLKEIYDPEIPVNIYALGLIYEINIKNSNQVAIKMTLTSPNCPVAESLPLEVKNKVEELPSVEDCHVEIVFEPPWNSDMMSDEAQLELGLL